MNTRELMTISVGPCWDVTCWGRRLDWGEHCKIDKQQSQPAGKAMNVSRALSWLGTPSVAAGLWGQADYPALCSELASLGELIEPGLTVVPGATRQNITIIDEDKGAELHLRAPNQLVSTEALASLRRDLAARVRPGTVCVWGGSMPHGQFLDEVVAIVAQCRDHDAHLVVDTSGDALRAIVKQGGLWLIKPNVQELRELLGEDVPDEPGQLASAAGQLTDKVDMVLVSRGENGAVAVTANEAWHGSCSADDTKVRCTVGCGDYLLAGFLHAITEHGDIKTALDVGLKVGGARAWGWADEYDWDQVKRKIRTTVRRLQT